MTAPPAARRASRARSYRAVIRSWAALLAAALELVLGAGCDRAPRLELATLLPTARLAAEPTEIELAAPPPGVALVAGWGPAQTDDGGSFVWGLGEASVLLLDLVEPREVELALRLRAYPFPPEAQQRIEVRANGAPVGTVELGSEVVTRRVTLPAIALRRGENELRFEYSIHHEPEIGADAEARPLAAAWYGIKLVGASPPTVPTLDDRTLHLPLHSTVETVVELADGARLTIDRLDGPAELGLEVAVLGEGRLEEERIVVVPEGRGVTVDLPTAPAGLARLALRTVGRAGGGADPALVLTGVALEGATAPTLPTAAPASPAEAGTTDAPGSRPDILVYVIDTLRADHLGCYGYDRPTSPALDAFAAEAVLFPRTIAQSSWTRPSTASILTGLYPTVHGVHDRDHALSPDVVTLAERLQGLGYQTAALVTNGNVTGRFGFRQGFEIFRYLPERKRSSEVHVLADRVNGFVLDWLATREDARPLFLYLHVTDPHAPYAPREPFRSRFAATADPAAGTLDRLKALGAGATPAPGEREAVVDLYDAEIAWTDAQFGALADGLRALGRWDDLAVAVLSDHGEEFLDHGRWQHGNSLYQEQLGVPFLLRLPAGEAGGTRPAVPARHIDLVPTLLDLVGAPIDPALQGRSLLPPIRSGDRSSPPSWSSLDLDGRVATSVIDGDEKLIHYTSWDHDHRPVELFDLGSDPTEQDDLSASRPLRRAWLETLLRVRAALWPTPFVADLAVIDQEMRERLEALGYLN